MEVTGEERKRPTSAGCARLFGMRLRGSMETLWREATKLAGGARVAQMV